MKTDIRQTFEDVGYVDSHRPTFGDLVGRPILFGPDARIAMHATGKGKHNKQGASAIDAQASESLFTAVDAFAGVGGMSLGAQQAGFRVKAAIEIDAAAVATYRRNLPDVYVLHQDIRSVLAEDFGRALGNTDLDALIGCAPCQGFCSLTNKVKREDPRNQLVLEMARLAEELRPRIIVMENVPGVLTRGRELFNGLTGRLARRGYHLAWGIVQMADYGVPQNRRRLVLIGARDFQPTIPPPTHARAPARGATLQPWRTLREAIGGLKAPVSLSVATKKNGPIAENWHVVRDLRPETKARLKAAMPGASRLDIDPALLPDCHQDGYSGFRNVYTRMGWTLPSPTITAGCLTPAKGRFGHPDRRRTTISVREAARIQTFPDSFSFETEKIDAACQMVGNAVPPLFAQALFSHLRNQLVLHRVEK